MANQTPPPELVEVYHLLKAGQRAEAARRLKAYLPQHRNDADAWWLLAHAVGQVEYQRHCLEQVLRLRPGDKRARAWLDRLTPAQPASSPTAPAPAPPRAGPPASAPTAALDEPDDGMILGLDGPPAVAAPRPPLPATARSAPPAAPRFTPPPPAAPARQEPPSFEEFAAQADVEPAPDDDPFGGAVFEPLTAAAEETSAAFADRADDPFDRGSLFDPAAHAKLRPAVRVVQAGGTGNQPEGGPGLAFVPEAPRRPAMPVGVPIETDRQRERAAVEHMLGRVLIVIAALVLLGIVLLAANSRGWFKGERRHVPDMALLDGGSFTMDYPKGYDLRCEREAGGYPVCGIANYPLFNEVDLFVGRQVDLGALIAQGLSLTQELPDEQFSVIVMDVPTTSPAYDNSSWAKTKYEWDQEWGGYWWSNAGVMPEYERQEITVDGHAGYYYRYLWEGDWRDAAWDVYVPHDGITLWLRIVFVGDRTVRLPSETVEAMIESIDLKPVAEW